MKQSIIAPYDSAESMYSIYVMCFIHEKQTTKKKTTKKQKKKKKKKKKTVELYVMLYVKLIFFLTLNMTSHKSFDRLNWYIFLFFNVIPIPVHIISFFSIKAVVSINLSKNTSISQTLTAKPKK